MMKFCVISTLIILGSVVTHGGSDIPSNCKWTDCEEDVISCQNVCSKNKGGWFALNTNKENCGVSSFRCECCKTTDNGEKKWTVKCHGRRFGAVSVCFEEFGHGFVPTGNKKTCSEAGTIRYECSN